VNELSQTNHFEISKAVIQTARHPSALDLEDLTMDGVLDIYDLGVVITHLISRLSRDTSQKL